MAADVKKKNGPSGYLVFFLLILIMAAAAVFLLPVFRRYQKRQAELNRVNLQLNNRKEERAGINAEVVGLKSSPETVEKVAREKFGLVKDGETVLKYEKPEKSK